MQDVLTRARLGDSEPETDAGAFVRCVADWLQRWLDHSSASSRAVGPCVFLHAGDLDPSQLVTGTNRAPSFRAAHDQRLAGILHVCAGELKNVYRKRIGFSDTSGALAWFENAKLTCYGAVIFSPRSCEALIHTAGASIDDCTTIHFNEASQRGFDFSQLDSMLDEFHEKHTKSHQGWCRVWHKPASRELKSRPEAQIQGSLLTFLEYQVRPKAAHLEEEFSTQRGRGDIRIVRWKPSLVGSREPPVLETCIMELKVLTQGKGPKGNLKWARSGIEQVQKYRQASGHAGPNYLCCYDARAINEDIPEITNEARAAGIIARRDYMETS